MRERIAHLHSLLDDGRQKLIISAVPAAANHSTVGNLHEPRAVSVSGQGAVGAKHVGSQHNAVFKLDAQHRGATDGRVPGREDNGGQRCATI